MASQQKRDDADAKTIIALGGLPHGWIAESFGHGFVLVKSPDGLMVTIDVKLRAIRDGGTSNGPYTALVSFSGRGWRKALLDAAVSRIKEVARG